MASIEIPIIATAGRDFTASIERETGRGLQVVQRNLRRFTQDTETQTRQLASGIGGVFDKLDTGGTFDGLAESAKRATEEAGREFDTFGTKILRDAERSADGLNRAFDQADFADQLIDEADKASDGTVERIEGLAKRVDRELEGIGDANSFDGLERAAALAADQVVDEFSDTGSKIERELEESLRKVDGRIEIPAEVNVDTAELDRILSDADQNFNVRVGTDTDRTEFDRLVADIDSAAADFDVSPRLDDAAAREVLGFADRLQDLSVRLNIEGQDEIRSVRGQIEGLADVVRVRLEADTQEARRKIEDAVEDPGVVEVKVDANTRSARARIGDLLGSLKDQVVKIGADTSEAQESLTDFIGGISLGDIGGQLSTGLLSGLSKINPAVAAAAAATGLLFGEEIAEGLDRGLNDRRDRLIRSIQTGFDEVEMREVGAASAAAWSAGFGESTAQLKEIATAIESQLSAIDTSLNLDEATKQVDVLTRIIGQDLASTVETTGRLINNNLAGDATEAFNLQVVAAQRLGTQAEETLEVLSEFAPVYRNLGISGGSAFNFTAESIERGLLPNIDRAAELFEEFNVQLTEGEPLQDVFAELNLDLLEFQGLLASGRGEEALTRIAEALLEVESGARRSALTNAVFLTSLESAGDSDEILELLEDLDDGLSGLPDALTGATEKTAELESGFGRLQRAVGSEFEKLGQDIDGILQEAFTAYDAVAGVVSDVSEFDFTFGLGGTELTKKLADTASATDEVIDGIEEVGETAEDTAVDIEGLTESLDDLVAQIAGGFDDDALFRDLREGIESALEAASEIDGGIAFNLTGGFNIDSEAGREVQELFEGQRVALAELTAGFVEGQVSGAQFFAEQARLSEGTLALAETLGVGAKQADLLVEQYGELSAAELAAVLSQTEELASGLSDAERAARAFSQLPTQVAFEFDIDSDGLLSVEESLRKVSEFERLISVGFDVDSTGLLEADEALDARTAIDYLLSVGFDTNFDGIQQAEEAALAFDALTFLATVGYDVDESGRIEADEAGIQQAAKRYISTIGGDPSSLLGTLGDMETRRGQFNTSAWQPLLRADSSQFDSTINNANSRRDQFDKSSATADIRLNLIENGVEERLNTIARARRSFLSQYSTRQADGGIMMADGGQLNGIAAPVQGGVSGLFNGQAFTMAENGGSELFLNSRSSFSRKKRLIEEFDGGNLDRQLRAAYLQPVAMNNGGIIEPARAAATELNRGGDLADAIGRAVAAAMSAAAGTSAAGETTNYVTVNVSDDGSLRDELALIGVNL